jgi:hypothetical protein
MRLTNKLLYLVIVLSLLLPAACTPAPATPAYPVAGNANNLTYPGGYPAPMGPVDTNPYPGQPTTMPEYIPTITPTYDPQFGIIHGRLLEADRPVVRTMIFLANIQKDDKGEDLVAAFSALDSVRVLTDENGEFTFMNVLPGRYAIILHTGMSAFLINHPGKEDPILFIVEAGQTTELGELNYDDLPLD